MAYLFIKFPKKFLDSEEWRKPRKYSKAEALLYLLNEPNNHSVGFLATRFQWSKSTVHGFLQEIYQKGFAERLPNGLPNDCRTEKAKKDNTLQGFAERLPNDSANDCRTDIKDKEYIPPVLSTTNVVSNTIPPKGMNEGNPDYLKFIEWLKSNAPRVLQMKEPITEEQFISLKNDFDAQFLCDLLREMHNYEPLLKKNRNANLTLRNWAKRRKQWDNGNTKSTTNTAGNAEPDELLRAVAEGIARSRTQQEWQS